MTTRAPAVLTKAGCPWIEWCVEESAQKLVAKIILKWRSEDNFMVLCGVSRYKASCSVYIKVGRSPLVAWLHSLFGETWSWCIAQRKLSLCSDAGGAVDDEDCDGSSIPSYISTTFRATQKLFFKRKNKEKFKSYCNIVLFLLPGESFRKKLNNKKGSPFV